MQTIGLWSTATNGLVAGETLQTDALVSGFLLVERAGRIGATIEGTSGQIEGRIGRWLAGQLATRVGAALLHARAMVIVRTVICIALRNRSTASSDGRVGVVVASVHRKTFARLVDELFLVCCWGR